MSLTTSQDARTVLKAYRALVETLGGLQAASEALSAFQRVSVGEVEHLYRESLLEKLRRIGGTDADEPERIVRLRAYQATNPNNEGGSETRWRCVCDLIDVLDQM
jgi:hypothetical protein